MADARPDNTEKPDGSDEPAMPEMPGGPDRLQRQIAFIRELDRLKGVFRQTYLMDGSRKENDTEHSWHLAVMATLLSEYAADEGLDVGRVVRMVLVHDVVEIDAGDTFVYDVAARRLQAERERAAAERIFAILPPDQAGELRRLWEEFEARRTPEARFAAALDRLQPLLHNYYTRGKAWREHGVRVGEVLARNRHMAEGSPTLWAFAERLIRDAVARGYLCDDER